ncbi:GDP-perosamine synthase [bioreactor metagenome]|uniref:GDP-perosamine synthase n=1 Tax=bioreactor metagenome TaxID=1076179 RepID=A0A644ZMF2_9ZZZZ
MKKLPYRVERKKEMGRLYWKYLSGISGVKLIETDFDQIPPWFYDIICENRTGLVEYLKEKGIGTRLSYPPLHLEPVYDRKELSFPVTESVANNILWLPSTISLTDEQIKYICGCIRDFYEK